MKTGAQLRAFVFVVSLVPAVATAFIMPNQNSRTICGEDKMEKMIDLDQKMQAMGRPIGIFSNNEGLCTATLISKDEVLTAHHCLADCSEINVRFGFLQRNRETFKCKEIVDTGNEQQNQDYLIVRLEGSPGVEWGWYDLSDRPVEPKTPLLIIHHPGGEQMKVSRKDCYAVEEKDGMLRHRCDTEPGSSGGAILIPDYGKPENTRVVGVHAYGGCNDTPDSYNSGPSIHYLSTLSPVIRSLVR